MILLIHLVQVVALREPFLRDLALNLLVRHHGFGVCSLTPKPTKFFIPKPNVSPLETQPGTFYL